MIAPRIALIHATPLAIEPVNSSFKKLWPEASLQNILDDSLSKDHAAAGHLTADMVERFIDLAQYAKRAGCQGILFTCSAFGEAIEAAAAAVAMPTLKPNDAMFEDALRAALKAHENDAEVLNIGLVATFAASIVSMSEEFNALTAGLEREVKLHSLFVPNAMDALAQGHAQEHHRLIAEGVQTMPGCDVIMLAQFSMAAAQTLAQTKTSAPILTSPECAVLALQKRMKND
jgi:aspartate/glutamate racemase